MVTLRIELIYLLNVWYKRYENIIDISISVWVNFEGMKILLTFFKIKLILTNVIFAKKYFFGMLKFYSQC